MVKKEVFEDIVIHANVCLKRWEDQERAPYMVNTRSMILTWLNKAYVRSYSNHTNWRERQAISRSLSEYMHYTTSDKDGVHITSITVKSRTDGQPLDFPTLDYEELHQRAKKLWMNTPGLTEIGTIQFNEIEQIKFN